MALKDWRKIRNNRWSKGRTILIIDKNTSGNFNIILGHIDSGERLLWKVKKTKTQAIAYAKRYMRTH